MRLEKPENFLEKISVRKSDLIFNSLKIIIFPTKH